MKQKIKDIISFFSSSTKIVFILKIILYIISVICIIVTLKYFGFFKEEKQDDPIIPGDVTVISQPSLDSGDIINDIDEMIEFLEKRKSEVK